MSLFELLFLSVDHADLFLLSNKMELSPLLLRVLLLKETQERYSLGQMSAML